MEPRIITIPMMTMMEFSDADELAYGSDPLDPNSVANATPNFHDLNGTTMVENLDGWYNYWAFGWV